jgi:acyl-CoA hydrolase
MVEHVLPVHANAHGTVFGGQIMAWMDICAAIAAGRHTRKLCVTAGVDDLAFQKPVKVGQVVRLMARVTATFKSSLELFVVVEGEDLRKGERWPCVTAFMTFVALEDDGSPAAVPPLLLENEEDRAFAREATDRRAERLAKAKRR